MPVPDYVEMARGTRTRDRVHRGLLKGSSGEGARYGEGHGVGVSAFATSNGMKITVGDRNIIDAVSVDGN